MTQVIEAIYTGGVFKPVADLTLPEAQRVRLIVEPLDEPGRADRAAALQRLVAGIKGMNFFSGGRLPGRDELHDRL